MNPQILRRRLRRTLPSAIAEVLIPALSWRVSPQAITVVIRNATWDEVFREHALIPMQEIAADFALPLTTLVIGDPSDQDLSPQHSQTFASFLNDPGNEFALATCRSISEAPGVGHNPLLIHGPVGVGKSHLLAAVAHELRSNLGREAVFACSGQYFVREAAQILADARAANDTSDPLGLEQAALICIDGIDSLSERPMAQEECYLLINRALDLGQQLLFSARSPAKRIAGLEDRLSSRLGWGLTIALDSPAFETRLRFLRRLVGPPIDGMTRDEISTLIDIHGGDMQQILTLGQRLRAGERPQTTAPDASFDRIIAAVAKACGVRASDIPSKSRQRHLVHARQAALLLGRRLTNHSLIALGGMVGGRDHSTVLHSLHQAEQRVAKDPAFAELISRLSQDILKQSR